VQQRFGQRRLARRAVADQCNGANAVRGVGRHLVLLLESKQKIRCHARGSRNLLVTNRYPRTRRS
jgi:hypothetical protein